MFDEESFDYRDFIDTDTINAGNTLINVVDFDDYLDFLIEKD